jgi:hypothetical protein
MTWKPFRSLLNNCKETTLLILKAESGGITFFEKITMQYHLLYCSLCRRFRKQSKQINRDLQQYSRSLEQNPPFKLTDDVRKRIEDSMR